MKTKIIIAFFVLASFSCQKESVQKPFSLTTTSNESSLAVKPKIGDLYGGGMIAWIDPSGRHGIIVGLEDLAPTVWSYNPYIDIQVYGGIVGDGKKNSLEIYRILQKVDNYAVLECKQYRGGGYKDWFLPSIIELGYAFTAGQYGATFNSDTAYWSSSAASAREAIVSAYPGAQGSHFKEWIRLVRPIRYF